MRLFDIGGHDDRPEVVTERVLTVPNVLSVLRLAALPVIYVDLVGDRLVRALSVLAVFAATDWLDGYIARRYGQISKLGTVLDPISDRLLVAVVGIAMIVADLVPWWAIAVLLARDLAVGVAGLVLLGRGRQPPAVTRIGKSATFGLLFALPLFVLAALVGDGVADSEPVTRTVAWALYAVSTALYYLAAVQYARALRPGAVPRGQLPPARRHG